MKNSAKAGFTLVELLIGVVMMSIVIAGIAFTVGSGFDLFTKVDSNAVVISGVRFTADSFKRTVSPMLNVTSEIEILPAASVIPAPASISSDIHYVFLSNNSVVHRDSQGDHELEGSEYIDNIEFSIPVSSADTQENYILKMVIHGKNNDNPNANLDLEVVSALYNGPEKIGTAVSGNYNGGVLKIRASLYLDRLDLYDDDTKIKINGFTMHKGTNIEAVYDIINQTGTSVPMSDDSTIEWFISGSVSADLPITEIIPDENNKNDYCWQLVLPGGNPLTGRVLNTTGTFHLKTGVTATDWEIGVIRCRVTPVVKLQGGGSTVTGVPKWSDYVVIKKVTDPSDEFENILDVLDSGTTTPNGTGDVFLTDVSTGHNENIFDVNSGRIWMTIDSPNKPDYGASFVMQLKYDKFNNDRIYGAWVAGRESASDIPSYITVTNYSVILDSKVKKKNNKYDVASTLFLSTRSNNSNFGKIISNNLVNEFRDVGYAVQYYPDGFTTDAMGFFVSKFRDGTEIDRDNKKPRPLGIYNETLNDRVSDCYKPESLNNSNFTFAEWDDRYRVLYTVLEYYDETQGKAYPRHIFRVRLLKRTDDWDANHSVPEDKLAEIKKRDPWCIGPKFYASEPMWFGDFVGNPNTTRTTGITTVKVKNYYYTTPQTATLNRKIDIATKIFYALKRSSGSDVFRRRVMDARASEKKINGGNISDTEISGALGGTALSSSIGSRYIGVRGVVKSKINDQDAVTIYGLDFAPGFSVDEIRSIMPASGKLYNIEETIISADIVLGDKNWYKSYKNIIATSSNDINKKVFGITAKSAGTGDNGSWYYQNAGSEGGIYDLQHIRGTCNCPLHNELFKWLSGQ
ncbi:MAG: type II secretion system protein [Synergistaceae bacterium]|nr:type II secretion system protein [Synergistaceae bacterium]